MIDLSRTTLVALTVGALTVAACAGGASLPPLEDENFPEPETTQDWEEWGEARPDTPPGSSGQRAQIIGDLLGNDDIRRAFSGQTLRGCYPNGQRFVERYATDGSFYEVTDTETYQGKWSVDEERFCFDYEVGPNADAPMSCFPVSREDGELYFYNDSFTGIVAATVCPQNQGS